MPSSFIYMTYFKITLAIFIIYGLKVVVPSFFELAYNKLPFRDLSEKGLETAVEY